MRLLSLEDLKTQKGIRFSRVHTHRLVKAGRFPVPVKLGSRNAWVESEIDEYLKGCVAERDAKATSTRAA
jgi:prophage regulatory protein